MTLQIIPDSLVAEIDQPARDAIQKIVRVEFGRGVLLSELVARFDKIPPAAPQLTLEKHVTSFAKAGIADIKSFESSSRTGRRLASSEDSRDI